MSRVYHSPTVVELADRRHQRAGKLPAGGGARVIQVEPPRGSPGRWCGPFVDDKVGPGRRLDYWWYNTGKQSAALDIGRQPAQDLLRRWLSRADKPRWTDATDRFGEYKLPVFGPPEEGP